jgi:hypothetical protein
VARNARLLACLASALALCATGAGSTSAATTPAFGPLIEHWDGSAWTQVPLPFQGSLSTVVAASANDVWALGNEDIGRADALHWDGSAWQQVAIPSPRRADEVNLFRAAAVAANDLWVVGDWAGPSTRGYRTLIEHWDGTAWSIVRTPNPSDNDALFGVTALSPKDAWAVGSYVVPRPGHAFWPLRTLILHWNGKAWKRVRSPNPSEHNPGASRHHDGLAAVAAVSARNVWAVGSYFRRGRNGRHSIQTLVLHWNGKHWKHVASPNPGKLGHPNGLYDVAATSATGIWAVGSYRDGSGMELPLVERRTHAWHAVPAPGPAAFADELQLKSVAPLSADDAWAAGEYLDDADLEPKALVEHWNGTGWTVVPTPSAYPADGLAGIAAVSANDVWAVGSWATD